MRPSEAIESEVEIEARLNQSAWRVVGVRKVALNQQGRVWN